MKLVTASEDHLDTLLRLVAAYHHFEGLTLSDAHRKQALDSLLNPKLNLGRVWLIEQDGKTTGYIALCFGYSIEFGGRDAFIDEFFIVESMRGQGIGSRVLESVKAEARALDIRALHLEVARDNHRAAKTYSRHGFTARDRYHLMTCRLA